jgi:hypothetical protein
MVLLCIAPLKNSGEHANLSTCAAFSGRVPWFPVSLSFRFAEACKGFKWLFLPWD